MAEYPELKQLSEQMKQELTGKRISSLEVVQEKCLNISQAEFEEGIQKKTVSDVYCVGKWIRIQLEDEYSIMLSLGMGADILYYENGTPKSDKYQCRLEFEQGIGFTCRFWWFGHFELYTSEAIMSDKKFYKIGFLPDQEEFTLEYFKKNVSKRSASIKNVIMGQGIVSGIGNAYIHDILYACGVHPLAKCNKIPEEVYDKLYDEIKNQMHDIKEMKGLSYEKDFYGKHGHYDTRCFQIAYKDGKECAACGEMIEKIKTGSISSFVCKKCQIEYQ